MNSLKSLAVLGTGEPRFVRKLQRPIRVIMTYDYGYDVRVHSVEIFGLSELDGIPAVVGASSKTAPRRLYRFDEVILVRDSHGHFLDSDQFQKEMVAKVEIADRYEQLTDAERKFAVFPHESCQAENRSSRFLASPGFPALGILILSMASLLMPFGVASIWLVVGILTVLAISFFLIVRRD